MMRPTPSIKEVQSYWQRHPLLAFEASLQDQNTFFDYLDHVKRTDVERFAMDYWNFESCAGKRVLDIGCGPGWLTVEYARHGARVTAIDLTQAAVDLTKAHLATRGSLRTCNAATPRASTSTPRRLTLSFPRA